MRPENRIRCPFGYTSMGWDTAPNFERAAAQTGNLVFYRERDYAGHFACLEDPNGMVEDIRAVVAANWSQARNDVTEHDDEMDLVDTQPASLGL